MKEESQSKALRQALREFEESIQAVRLVYREKVSAIIKASDQKKAESIRDSLLKKSR